MKIKKICFYSVNIKETTTCDCCGKGIKNIYFITMQDNTTLTLGSTCFSKQIKNNLNNMARKKVNHALETLQSLNNLRCKWETLTEEEYLKTTCDNRIGKYEGIDTFEDLRKWYLNEFIPYRESLEQETISKYTKL